MARTIVLNGPKQEPLIRALTGYGNGSEVFFTVRQPEAHVIKVYVRVRGVEWIGDLDRVAKLSIELNGRDFVGLYNLADRTGWWVHSTEYATAPLARLGLDADLESTLVAAGIRTWLELVMRDEFEICRLLLGDLHGAPVTMGRVLRALQKFLRLRDQLNERGDSFVGGHHTKFELYSSFIPS